MMKHVDPKHARLSSSNEQLEACHVEKTASAYIAGKEISPSDQVQYDDSETKRILRKIDWRLLPVLTLLYLIAFLDRGNIGNAKVAGMNADLKLTGAQYNLALTVFFFTYALLEVPSNIILKCFKRSSHYIAILVTVWGGIMLGMGFVKNFEQLAATRVLLGVFEAGFFPGATFIVTTWYCRFEIATKIAIFFSMASMAGAFSGLLAFALSLMDGLGGLAGWRWIFIIEGLATVLIGLTVPWILPDSPQLASFLTPAEKEFVLGRLAAESGAGSSKAQTQEIGHLAAVKSALSDWKIWFTCLIYNAASIPVYGFSYTAPTIITSLGYTGRQANLLTIPPYFVGAAATLIFARIADKKQSRWPFIVIPFSLAMIGFLGLISIPHPRLPGLTYAFLFFIPAGVYPPVVALISWVGNNLAPTWKRAVGMALMITLGNLGGAIGSNIYLQKQAPRYWLGHGFSIGVLTVGTISTFILRWAYMRENKKRDLISEAEARERYTEEELLNLGDRSPLFRYVL